MRLLVIFAVFLSLKIETSVNSFGQIGYINAPSAFNHQEGSVAFSLKRDYPNRNLNLTLSPFNWLDFTVFYVDIVNKEYPGGFKQSYKDKGFNLKFSLKEKGNWPAIAIGMNDIAGTGYFSSEYIVLTDFYDRFEYSFGVGWGEMTGGLRFRNPFIELDDKFQNRLSFTKDNGGTFSAENYFSGDDASFFAALSYAISRDSKLLLELDPINKNSRINYRENRSKYNIGFEKKIKNFDVGIFYNNGKYFSLQASASLNFLNYSPVNKIYPEKSPSNYNELNETLKKNSIGLKSINENEKYIRISVNQNSFTNQYEVNQIVYDNMRVLNKKKKDIQITQNYLDMEVVNVFYEGKRINNPRNEQYKDLNTVEGNALVFNKLNFPHISSNIFPTLRNQIASREGFIFSSLLLENNTEVLFSENLILLSNLKYSIYDNFDELYIEPVDIYPNEVRTDIKKYLNNFDNGIFLGRFELNYFKSFKNAHFFRLYTGLFEEMFGGYGVDYQYYPQGSFFSIGLESYFVKKRDYRMKLDFLDYSNHVNKLNFTAYEPRTKIKLKLSLGEYLAGDKGYTLDFSRRFHNGVEIGAFFTRTDVSFDQYGEGSFDKGIKFTIPFSLLGSDKRLSKYEWHPLTKNPGALLIKSVDITDELIRYRSY